jgi:hypothetical protein
MANGLTITRVGSAVFKAIPVYVCAENLLYFH